MNFEHFQKMVQTLITEGNADEKASGVPEQLHPLALAYIGDAYFNLYVRTRLLSYNQDKVRVLHTVGSKMVSAVMQAKAVAIIEGYFSEKETQVLRRGRNTKSKVPKSASVQEYRYSTGFESVLGYLFLKKDFERLDYIADKSFTFILQEMNKET